MLSPFIIIFILLAYFMSLLFIAKITASNNSNDAFFIGDKKSPWYIVAYGMIGVSLSGITFLSVPGWVESKEFFYMQMVLGYVPGYLFIAYVLMPIYYKLKVYSIYEYLGNRIGYYAHKSGAFYFFLSRLLGASLRLFLVAEVFQLILFDSLGIPFFITALVTILMIWLYTYRGGIKTIIWTDTLQTTFMLLTVVICIASIFKNLGYSSVTSSVLDNNLDLRMFLFSDFNSSDNFFRSFFSGMFIAIAMTGLDQDMMQKNLSCQNIQDAQKNMIFFSIILVFVNLLFLYLGALLYQYAFMYNITASGDNLFIAVVQEGGLGFLVFILFILGLVSAAYSSADSALTSLTTSFCVDFLAIKKIDLVKDSLRTRKFVHVLISFLLLFMILLVKYLNNDSIISTLFLLASYTYGPLLGLFLFGVCTERKLFDKYVPFVVLIAPVLSYFISIYDTILFSGFDFGPDLIIINGLITFILLMLISKK